MKPKVLVVDDDPVFRRLAAGALSGCCEIVEASCLEEAKARFEESVPRLVLLDVLLPDGEGTSLIRRFAGPETAVVMLTSVEGIESAQRAIAEGACEYLTKPVRVEQLRNIAERRLRTTQGEQTPWRTS